MTTRFVLVPGFWLGGWAWDAVVAELAGADVKVTALTLPGLEGPDAVRAGVTLQHHVDAVLTALHDAVDPGGSLPVLVAHSGANAPVGMAVDRAPELVGRVVYVDSGPLPDGAAVDPTVDPAAVELPLPSLAEFSNRGTSVEGLDEEQLAEFRRRAVPHPAGPAREPVRLTDPRRHRVPTTLVTSSFGVDDVRGMIAAGHPWFSEVAATDHELVGLPTGHWPMWSRPVELAEILLSAAG
jgi:pimeloyl-ACP methyl ester carboxylesterase